MRGTPTKGRRFGGDAAHQKAMFGNLVASPRFFNDGLITGLHGADLSGLVSIAVAAAVYWGGRRSVRS